MFTTGTVLNASDTRGNTAKEGMMVTRRSMLIAVGLTVAALWEPATAGATQKTRTSKPQTITLAVQGMT